jgi:hypothetical protein
MVSRRGCYCRAPQFDVATAVEVLASGTFAGLPAILDTLRTAPSASDADRHTALARLTRLVRLRVLRGGCPAPLRHVRTGPSTPEEHRYTCPMRC